MFTDTQQSLRFIRILCIIFLLCRLFDRASTYAAVDPNNQLGQCGPYYIWYQTGPDIHSQPTDFVDVYSITFDLNDVVDDFDFVYFTGGRSILDANRDGISDQYFSAVRENQVQWKPEGEYVRINQRGCWGTAFNSNCGYAMISIQPKSWFKNGKARIPIHVSKRCSPAMTDCSEMYTIVHEYANCNLSSLPDFIINEEVNEVTDTTKGRNVFEYSITLENTTNEPSGTDITNIFSEGSNGGRLFLYYFNIDCPKEAICRIEQLINNQFTIKLSEIPPHEEAIISYNVEISPHEIEFGETSYFTNTATLSTGGSVQRTIGLTGTGIETKTGEPGRRPERPRQSQ